jgi:hypothetical protein
LKRVAEPELIARARENLVLTDDGHDRARHQREPVAELEGDHGLNIGRDLRSVFRRPDPLVIIDLDRKQRQRRYGIGKLLLDVGILRISRRCG